MIEINGIDRMSWFLEGNGRARVNLSRNDDREIEIRGGFFFT